jgi:type VI secretion system secreted protein Hcp
MAFDAYIKIDGIEGESTDSKHSGWIEATDCDMEINQTISETASSAGGAGAGRADFSDFSFSKLLDRSSPKLAQACAAGTHFNNIVVELCRAGTEKIKFLEIKLTDSMISRISLTAGGEFPSETIGINYGKIQWTYLQQKREGGGIAGNIITGWDRRRNCKV